MDPFDSELLQLIADLSNLTAAIAYQRRQGYVLDIQSVGTLDDFEEVRRKLNEIAKLNDQ